MTTTPFGRDHHESVLEVLKAVPAHYRNSKLQSLVHLMPRRVPNRRTQSVETMLALVLADEYTFLTFRQHDGSRDNYPATPWYSAVPIIEIRVRFVDNGSMVLEARFHNVNHAEYSVWRALGDDCYLVNPSEHCKAQQAYIKEHDHYVPAYKLMRERAKEEGIENYVFPGMSPGQKKRYIDMTEAESEACPRPCWDVRAYRLGIWYGRQRFMAYLEGGDITSIEQEATQRLQEVKDEKKRWDAGERPWQGDSNLNQILNNAVNFPLKEVKKEEDDVEEARENVRDSKTCVLESPSKRRRAVASDVRTAQTVKQEVE